MSKLAERIKRATRAESAPLGFGVAAERRAAPTMLCLLRLDGDRAGKLGAGAAAGADAAIISGLAVGKLGAVLKKLGDVPVGLALGSTERATVAAARDAGVDFLLLEEQSPAEAVLEDKVGFVLSVDTDMSDAELRALGGLPLDALEAPVVGEPFTLRRLIELRRLSMLSQTPLLVDVAAEVGPTRLESLREAGAAGVIVEGTSADKLAALREAVLSLPPRGWRRDERTEALVPSLTGAPSDEVEEPDLE
jgi:hypothetical protein